MAPRKYQESPGSDDARIRTMPNRSIGPVWAAVLKFLAALAVPITLGIFAWARNVEGRISTHDIKFGVSDTDRTHIQNSLTGLNIKLEVMDDRLRKMQADIAVLSSRAGIASTTKQ